MRGPAVSPHPRIYLRGKCYRLRRGHLVQIPPCWIGRTLHPQTRRKRQSKYARKQRMRESPQGHADTKCGGKPEHPRTWAPRHTVGSRAHSEQGDIRETVMPNDNWKVPLEEVRTAAYAEHEALCPVTHTPCLLCGHPVVKPWPHVVQLIDGGRTIVAEDAAVDVTDPGYVGCWPVGSRCYQRLLHAIEVS